MGTPSVLLDRSGDQTAGSGADSGLGAAAGVAAYFWSDGAGHLQRFKPFVVTLIYSRH